MREQDLHHRDGEKSHLKRSISDEVQDPKDETTQALQIPFASFIPHNADLNPPRPLFGRGVSTTLPLPILQRL